MTTTKQLGFTLLELMITVAIVGLLVAIALPSYRNYVLRGHRAEGRAAILDLMQQEERYSTQNNCYLGFTNSGGTATASAPSPTSACGGVTASSVPFKTYSGDNLGVSYYLLSASSCGSGLSIQDCVQVTATPVASDPEVGNISLTSTGTKSCSGTTYTTDPTKCWQ